VRCYGRSIQVSFFRHDVNAPNDQFSVAAPQNYLLSFTGRVAVCRSQSVVALAAVVALIGPG
jgi:hypothetical protein